MCLRYLYTDMKGGFRAKVKSRTSLKPGGWSQARLSCVRCCTRTSLAVFDAKSKDMGLEGYKDEMSRRGWTTMSAFALASSWSPGSGDDQAFIQQVASQGHCWEQDHADLPKLRKLYQEAYAIVAAELRSRLEGTQEADGSKTRKLKAAYAAYAHTQLTDQLEPAHHVVDKFHSMRVRGVAAHSAA